jgi:hypothetical protein
MESDDSARNLWREWGSCRIFLLLSFVNCHFAFQQEPTSSLWRSLSDRRCGAWSIDYLLHGNISDKRNHDVDVRLRVFRKRRARIEKFWIEEFISFFRLVF